MLILSKEHNSLKKIEILSKKLIQLKNEIHEIYNLYPSNVQFLSVYQIFILIFQKYDEEILNNIEKKVLHTLFMEKEDKINFFKSNENSSDSCFLHVSGNQESLGKILKADFKFNLKKNLFFLIIYSLV